MRKKSWNKESLKIAVKNSISFRQVLQKLNLIPAGGNYAQIKKYIRKYKIDTSHFRGQGWSFGLKLNQNPKIPLEKILVNGSDFQSFKLKKRLFAAGIKFEYCEECGWAEKTFDGYLPLELDHINGDRRDNRIENLRILCPNCHSLKPTHRGKNKNRPGGGTGIRATLKML